MSSSEGGVIEGIFREGVGSVREAGFAHGPRSRDLSRVSAALVAVFVAPAFGADRTQWLQVGGRLHPMLVHFPIALIFAAVAFEAFRIVRRQDKPSTSAVACLFLAVLGAAAAVVTGWIHSDAEGMSGDVPVELHRWVGIGAGVMAACGLAFALAAGRSGGRTLRRMYVLCLLLAAGAVAFTGHEGGEIVYGANYVLKPLDRRVSTGEPIERVGLPAEATSARSVDFDQDLKPIFERSCVECHGATKQKGHLRLDSFAALQASRYFADDIVPGAPASSELYIRVTLPEDDHDFMPKEGDPLAPEEVALIRNWIAGLAVVAEGGASDVTAEETAPPTPEVSIDPDVILQAISQVESRGGYARVLSATDARLVVNYSVLNRELAADDLAVLEPVAQVIEELNIGGIGATDALLASVREMGGLHKLNLSRSKISDAGLASLAVLEHLEVLNCYGCDITDESVDALRSFPALKTVYLWQTSIDESGVALLAADRPDLEIVSGVSVEQPVTATEAAPQAPAESHTQEAGD